MRAEPSISAGLLAVFVGLLACTDPLDGTLRHADRLCLTSTECYVGDICLGALCLQSAAARAEATRASAPPAELLLSRSDPWALWGTRGVELPSSESGEGWLCAAVDVRTDDLAGDLDDAIPEQPWPASPAPDLPGRCGNDLETLSWRLTNCERIARGYDPVSCDLRLVWAGRLHARDMVDRGYIDHRSPDGKGPFDRLDELGVSYSWAGENLAVFQDVESAHMGWMRSDAHRVNLLNPAYQRGGVGIASDGGRLLLLTETFTRP